MTAKGIAPEVDMRRYYLKRSPLEWFLAVFVQAMTVSSLGEAIWEFTGLWMFHEQQELSKREDRLRCCVDQGSRTILLVRHEGKWYFPHYITVEGYDENGWYIFDPACDKSEALAGGGNRYISCEELLDWWRPNPLFKFGPERMQGCVILILYKYGGMLNG